MSNIPTPHISCADASLIAETVLMPGDPLRAKFIADNYLTDVLCFTSVRNNLGYTGYYNGKKVSVMSSGMGMPSLGIYATELYLNYNVQTIIRIGSCGSYSPEYKLFDVLLATSCYSESTYAKVAFNDDSCEMEPSQEVNNKLIESASKLNIELHSCKVHSSDVFYHANDDYLDDVVDLRRCQVVEMESFVLFSIAKNLTRNAACLLTVSDSFITAQKATSEEREKSLTSMIKIALESI